MLLPAIELGAWTGIVNLLNRGRDGA